MSTTHPLSCRVPTPLTSSPSYPPMIPRAGQRGMYPAPYADPAFIKVCWSSHRSRKASQHHQKIPPLVILASPVLSPSVLKVHPLTPCMGVQHSRRARQFRSHPSPAPTHTWYASNITWKRIPFTVSCLESPPHPTPPHPDLCVCQH